MPSTTNAAAPRPPAQHVVVGIATLGRRDLLIETARELARQTRAPDEVLISPGQPDDIDEAAVRAILPCPLRVVYGPRGSSAQRNTILAAAPKADVMVFFDDDFFMAPDYLLTAERILGERDDVLMLTGEVIADGASKRGYDPETARALLAADRPPAHGVAVKAYTGYGCNMAFKMAPARALNVTFDESLPLYGWLEDLDFSRSLVAKGGEVIRTPLCRGVHLGAKSGRTSGLRFGYSQIANPLYLLTKGTMTPGRAILQMAENVVANTLRVLVPEPWVDRRGRMKGNLLGLTDLLRGRLKPQNILHLS